MMLKEKLLSGDRDKNVKDLRLSDKVKNKLMFQKSGFIR